MSAALLALLTNSQYSVDVYRPTKAQQAVPGFSPAQWVELHPTAPTLSGVAVVTGGQPTAEDLLILANVQGRILKLMWMDDDIRPQDILLLHGPSGGAYDGRYFTVHQVTIEDTFLGDSEKTALLTELHAGP